MKIKLSWLLLFGLLFSLTVTSCNAKSNSVYHDTTISSKVKLRSSVSIESNFGDLMSKLDANEDFPDIYFRNKAGTEYLRLVFYPGDNQNAFSLFEVSGTSFNNEKLWPSSFANFATESGIRLGLAKSEVIKKIGKNYTETKTGNITKLRYEIDKNDDKDFLSRYNMPFYFGEYIFKNDVLDKFSFGFEYP